MKRKPLRRISTKRQVKLKDDRVERYAMLKMFLDTWKARPHYCESCGKWLGNESRTFNFDHLLEKSKYPDLKFDTDNIFLCCWECHDLKNNGHPTEKHQQAIDNYVKLLNS